MSALTLSGQGKPSRRGLAVLVGLCAILVAAWLAGRAAERWALSDLRRGARSAIGLQVGVLLAGAILTETIFSWPGIGKWMVDAVFKRDYAVVQGGLLLIAGVIMLVNLAVDVTYGFINPRIRH